MLFNIFPFFICLLLLNISEQLTLKNKPKYDSSLDDDNDNLLYNADLDADDELTTESSQSLVTQEPTLDELMLELLKNTDSSNNNKCDQYKLKITDHCMAKFQQRSRYRVNYGDNLMELDGLPSAQQICCEFRLTFLRCLVSNLNYICSPEEFTALYKKHEGLMKICSHFFNKSSKKCRRYFPVLIHSSILVKYNTTSV